MRQLVIFLLDFRRVLCQGAVLLLTSPLCLGAGGVFLVAFVVSVRYARILESVKTLRDGLFSGCIRLKRRADVRVRTKKKVSLVAFLIILLTGIFLIIAERSEANETQQMVESDSWRMVADGIRRLQPWYLNSRNPRVRIRRDREFTRLVSYIHNASEQNGIDPRIAVVVGFRESSLLPSIHLKTGSRGERGYFQVMPRSLAVRVCGDGCDQKTPQCNANTAMCYLSYCRELCGDSPWLYVGGYGRSRCPESATEARTWREVRRARRLLCHAYGDWVCDEVWPIPS